LEYNGNAYTPVLAYTDGCSYSTDENQIPPFFSLQITRGQNPLREGCLDRAEAAGFKVVWHPEAATSWSSSQQTNY